MQESQRQQDLAMPPSDVRVSALIRRAALPAIAVCLAVVALWWIWPRLTEEHVRETIISTLATEAQESFYVTGTLTFSSTVESRSEKTFLPGILNLSLGTTTATVRVPGRVAYGFDVGGMKAEHIHYGDDGVVDIALPRLTVFSVEPEMENVEIQTDVGWARLHRSSGQAMEQQALQAIRPTMRETAERHMASSETPEFNTAGALVRLLTPPLQAGGIRHPQFRFHLASGGILELTPSDVAASEG